MFSIAPCAGAAALVVVSAITHSWSLGVALLHPLASAPLPSSSSSSLPCCHVAVTFTFISSHSPLHATIFPLTRLLAFGSHEPRRPVLFSTRKVLSSSVSSLALLKYALQTFLAGGTHRSKTAVPAALSPKTARYIRPDLWLLLSPDHLEQPGLSCSSCDNSMAHWLMLWFSQQTQ